MLTINLLKRFHAVAQNDLTDLIVVHGIAGFIIGWIEEDFPNTPTYMAEQTVELMTVSTEVFHRKGI